MLGDRIKSAFEKVGITEERYKAAKQAVGLPPTCGCKNRQDMLNRWEEKARKWLNEQLHIEQLHIEQSYIERQEENKKDPE